MKTRTIWWIVISCVVLLVIIIVIGKRAGGDEIKVATEKASRHTITETVTASGKIYPESQIAIAPEVSGEVIEMYVQEGDSVKKGAMLVKINPAIYTSMVDQAQASVEQTRANANNTKELMAQAQSQYQLALATYNRNKKLFEQKVISQLEFEQGEASYKSAKASFDAAVASTSGGQYGIRGAQAGLSQAMTNLKKTTITAPTSGIISAVNVGVGTRVVGTAQMAGTEMLTIADMSRIEVQVDVSETDISKVKVGDTTLIDADAYRNRKFKGIVSHVAVSAKTGAASASTDQVTNYTVHILILPSSYADLSAKLERGKYPFKPGMSASVEIETKKQEHVLSVPVNAVTTRDWPDSLKNKNTALSASDNIRQVVFVYNGKTTTVAMRDVKTGLQDNKYLEITDGLNEGEEVVTAPYGAIARILKDKTKVKVVDKDKLFEVKKD
jgi:HlyD family secretion protein